MKGGEGGGACGAKEAKRGVRGQGWGQEQELPKVCASYCCNPPFNNLPLSECLSPATSPLGKCFNPSFKRVPEV